VVVLPVVARNYLIGHQFVLTTAHGGMNLYTGNNAYSLGPYTPLPFADPNPYAEIRGFHAEAERRAGHSLSVGEADRFWYKESWNFIRERPAQWLALIGKKVLIFFNNYEDSINLNYYVFREESKSLLGLPLIAYGIVFPLGLWGMIVCGWKNSASRLLSSYVIFYFLADVAFFVVSEYRYPVVPVLAIFAGQGTYWFFRNGNVRRRALKVFGMIFIIFMFWLSRKDIYKDWFGLPSYEEAGLANAYYSMGTVYAHEKILDKAGEFYEKSIEIQPQTGALVELGDLYASQGQVQKAKQMLEYAVRMDPLDPQCAKAYKDLGLISLSAGNSQEAERYFRQAEQLRPRTLK
jgi:tetratricopeptide (TPR) repeat protein